MASLEMTTDALLALHPLIGVDVVTAVNAPDRLEAYFLRRDAPDHRRDWASILAWKAEFAKHGAPEFPIERFDPVYMGALSLYTEGVIGEQDQVVMHLDLRGDGERVARLRHIRRHGGVAFRGTGAAVLRNLKPVLYGKGYEYLTLIPTHAPFYEGLGVLPHAKLPEPHRSRLNTNAHVWVLG